MSNSLSLTPGFSPVPIATEWENRFNPDFALDPNLSTKSRTFFPLLMQRNRNSRIQEPATERVANTVTHPGFQMQNPGFNGFPAPGKPLEQLAPTIGFFENV